MTRQRPPRSGPRAGLLTGLVAVVAGAHAAVIALATGALGPPPGSSVQGRMALPATTEAPAPRPVTLATPRRPVPEPEAPAGDPAFSAAARATPATSHAPAPAAYADEAVTTEPSARDPAAAFMPTALLDRGAVPVSAPEADGLTGSFATGLPLTVRLLIDAHGTVVAVLPQQVNEDDRELFERIRQMFLATRFLPGRLGGRDVASRLDIELQSQRVEPESAPDASPAAAVHP